MYRSPNLNLRKEQPSDYTHFGMLFIISYQLILNFILYRLTQDIIFFLSRLILTIKLKQYVSENVFSHLNNWFPRQIILG